MIFITIWNMIKIANYTNNKDSIKLRVVTFYKFHGGLSGKPTADSRMFSLSVCGQEITRNPPRNL